MPAGKESLSDMVYTCIKNKILHLEFHPKDRISEESISEQTGISRTPVREALRRLSNEGLITIYPKRYTEVTYYDNEMIRQIGTLRLSQDILAAQLAMYYGSDSDFDELDSIAARCEEAGLNLDIYGRIQLDSEFHLKIAEIGQNALLLKYQQELYLKVHLIQIIKYNITTSKHLVEHHPRIIKALREKNETSLIREICNHLVDFFYLDTRIVEKYITMLKAT